MDRGSALGLGALIAAFLGAPFVIYGTWLKHKTNRLEQEGHMTDRITKAVEQLGAEKLVKRDGKEESFPNIEVRIGAILSLERIAQDSTMLDRGRDHVRVMEILCAYIRHNAPATDAHLFPLLDWEPLKENPSNAERTTHEQWRATRFNDEYTRSNAWEWAQSLGPPRVDIAEALKVIGRRNREQMLIEAAWPQPYDARTIWPFDNTPCLPDGEGEAALDPHIFSDFERRLDKWKNATLGYSGYRLDLRGTNLQRADLSSYCLQGARLHRARLEGANLSQARMTGADLSEARIEGATLYEVELSGATLSKARLEGVDLRKALLQGADLTHARMERANFWRARLEGALLWDARMEVTRLHETRLEWARLMRARMEGAELWDARMALADLREAQMKGASLWMARMQGANLSDARMEGTNLRAARLEGANFENARMDWALLAEARMDIDTSLRAASLRGAALRIVDFSSVHISAKQLNSAFGDASVIVPSDIARPAHWSDWELPSESTYSFPTQWQKWLANPDTYTPPPNPNP
jgi:uncharacterized protein YjbI with pentapeptide repeats